MLVQRMATRGSNMRSRLLQSPPLELTAPETRVSVNEVQVHCLRRFEAVGQPRELS